MTMTHNIFDFATDVLQFPVCLNKLHMFCRMMKMAMHGFSTANKGFKIVKSMPPWRSGLIGKWMNTGIQTLKV